MTRNAAAGVSIGSQGSSGTIDTRTAFGGVINQGRQMDILRIILSVIIPPVGVFLQVGLGLQFWLNILLTLLGYFPGLIHAIWVILRK